MTTDYGAAAERYKRYTIDQEEGGNSEQRLGRTPARLALGDINGKVVLELGCGPGTNGRWLRENGATFIGLDADAKVIEAARQHDPHSEYRVYNGLLAEAMRGVHVDLILMSFAFCAIPDTELRYILRDMRNILPHGGKLIIVDPNQEKAHGVKYRELHYLPKEGVQSGDYVSVLLGSGEDAIHITDDVYRRHADYRRLLKEAGFSIETIEEPMPGYDWDGDWTLERKYPPFLLIVAT